MRESDGRDRTVNVIKIVHKTPQNRLMATSEEGIEDSCCCGIDEQVVIPPDGSWMKLTTAICLDRFPDRAHSMLRVLGGSSSHERLKSTM